MNRMFAAGLLALPALTLAARPADAQTCATCPGGGGGPVGSFMGGLLAAFTGGPHHLAGCTACYGMFAGLHQHGPLYNYGPYAGYYPFEPYGPWTSDLRYTGPDGRGGGCGAGGCGRQHHLGGHGLGGHSAHAGGCGAGGCGGGGSGWGHYATATFKNVFARSHPCANRATISTGSSAAPASGCVGCAASAAGAPVVQSGATETAGGSAAEVRGFRER